MEKLNWIETASSRFEAQASDGSIWRHVAGKTSEVTDLHGAEMLESVHKSVDAATEFAAVKNALAIYAEMSGMTLAEIGRHYAQSAECRASIVALVAMQAGESRGKDSC